MTDDRQTVSTPPLPQPLAVPLAGPKRTIAGRLIAGGGWIALQTIVSQLLALFAKIVVFRELSSDDLALAIWAMSGCIFFAWLQFNVSDVLVQRQHRFGRWLYPGYSLSVANALLLLVVGIAAGPFLGMLYDHRLWPLNSAVWSVVILTLATSACNGLAAVWVAELTIRMRFGTLAAIAGAGAVLTAGFAIAMARYCPGPLTLALPPAVGSAFMLLLYAGRSTIPLRFPDGASLRKGLALFPSAFSLTLGAAFSGLVMQADNFFLGLFQREALPAYAVAYAMAFTLVQVLSRSLRIVLLPTFSSMNLKRWETGYLESLRLACALVMPVAMLTIAPSRALVLAIFSAKWAAAIPLLQIFLPGMGFTTVFAIAFTAMQSRARYRRFLGTNAAVGIAFVVLAFPLSYFASAKVLAGGAMVFYAVTSTLCAMFAAPLAGGFRVRIVGAVLVPFVLAGLSAGTGAGMAWVLKVPFDSWGYALVPPGIGSVFYIVSAAVFMPSTFRQAVARFGQAVARNPAARQM